MDGLRSSIDHGPTPMAGREAASSKVGRVPLENTLRFAHCEGSLVKGTENAFLTASDNNLRLPVRAPSCFNLAIYRALRLHFT